MRIAIIGVSGFIGSHIKDEALYRGHEVLGIYRKNPVEETKKLTLLKQSIFDEKKLEEALKNSDCVISAYNPGYFHIEQAKKYQEGYEIIINVCQRLNKRLIIVIAATTLKLDDDTLVKDNQYPAVWINAQEGIDLVYQKYKESNKNITFVSPAVEVIDTIKTNDYTVNEDYLVTDNNGMSRISVQDLASSIIDEVENPKFLNKRYTIGYTK